tara:strand:- start:291 stop:839 length:549 start_codon:yes stop_codon:yes gene_type:complete
MKKKIPRPGVLWITGLSGAGKTTTGDLVFKELNKEFTKIKRLDGDLLRKKLKLNRNKKTFTAAHRKKNGATYSKICKHYESKGYFVIISVMALYNEVYKKNKKIFKNYIGVYLKVPIKELIRRDPKKLYKKFFQKKIKNIAGLDLKFDEPKNCKINVKWSKKISSISIKNKIIKYLKLKKCI